DPIGLDQPVGKRTLDLRREERVSALTRELQKIGTIEDWRRLGKHTLVYVTPEVRRRLPRSVQENVAFAAGGDLVAPPFECLAQDRRQADAHEIERSQDLNGAHVRRGGIRRRERETPCERDRDPGVAKDQVRLREGADGPSLPERAAGVGRRTVGIDGPVPVSNEVVKPAGVPLHVEDEVDEADRPLSESAIAGVTIEVEK